jgi:hypothetical protein
MVLSKTTVIWSRGYVEIFLTFCLNFLPQAGRSNSNAAI